MDIERQFFEAVRGEALEKLASDFSTADYQIAIAHVCGEAPCIEIARKQLADCETVIRVGLDSWMKLQLTKGDKNG